ncbi:hypothetical protein [Blautia sp. SC05B48]
MFDITDCPLKEGEIMEQVNNLFRSTHLSFFGRNRIVQG